jgi:osmotically inducible protein OsmC
MALSGELVKAGYDPEAIRTTALVHVDPVEGGFEITRSELTTYAVVPDIDDDEFQELANNAKEGCPVSKALAGVEIMLEAELVDELPS